MRKTLLFLISLAVLFPVSAKAITALQVQNAVQARFAVLWPILEPFMNACLENQEDCYTTWSIGGTGAVADLCNTVTADSAVCTMAQVDEGVPDSCGIAAGSHSFASYGITLTTPDIMAYKINSYAGPGGRGAQVCARLKYNGAGYEKCYANGPQAAAFTDAAWRAIQ
jgi:hypothetical protein